MWQSRGHRANFDSFFSSPIADLLDESLGRRANWSSKTTYLNTKFDKRLKDSRSSSNAKMFFKEFHETWKMGASHTWSSPQPFLKWCSARCTVQGAPKLACMCQWHGSGYLQALSGRSCSLSRPAKWWGRTPWPEDHEEDTLSAPQESSTHWVIKVQWRTTRVSRRGRAHPGATLLSWKADRKNAHREGSLGIKVRLSKGFWYRSDSSQYSSARSATLEYFKITLVWNWVGQKNGLLISFRNSVIDNAIAALPTSHHHS